MHSNTLRNSKNDARNDARNDKGETTMETTHKLFEIAAFDHLEENTPRVYLRALAGAFGSDARLGDLLLAATEAELDDSREDTQVLDEVASSIADELATAEGLEPRSPEWAERSTELSLGRFHAIRDACKAKRETVTA